SELHVTQRAWPLDLKIAGTLYGKDFMVKDRAVGDLAIKLNGSADSKHLQLASTRMEMLQGIWGLRADLQYPDWQSDVEISLKDLSLAQLDGVADPPPKLVGVMGGRWNLHLPAFDVNRMTADGEYNIANLGQLKTAPPPAT